MLLVPACIDTRTTTIIPSVKPTNAMVDPLSEFIRRRKRGRKTEISTSDTVVVYITKSQRNGLKAFRSPPIAGFDFQHHHRIAEIYIGHGCLLIPAIFLVWWYWTKRTARRVVHGVITFTHRGRSSSSMSTSDPLDTTPTICNGDDDIDVGSYFNGCTAQPSSSASQNPNVSSSYYRSWEDAQPERSSSDSTTNFRFIDWMKRTKSSRTRQAVQTTTLSNLHNNAIPRNGTNQKHTETVPPLPNHENDAIETNRKLDSTPKFITHIQAPSSSTHGGIEMFVIEYPQQMSHQARVTTPTPMT